MRVKHKERCKAEFWHNPKSGEGPVPSKGKKSISQCGWYRGFNEIIRPGIRKYSGVFVWKGSGKYEQYLQRCYTRPGK